MGAHWAPPVPTNLLIASWLVYSFTLSIVWQGAPSSRAGPTACSLEGGALATVPGAAFSALVALSVVLVSVVPTVRLRGLLLGCGLLLSGGLLLRCGLLLRRRLLLGCGLLLGSLVLREGRVEHGLVVLYRLLEEEVRSELLVLVAGQVGLRSALLREAERH